MKLNATPLLLTIILVLTACSGAPATSTAPANQIQGSGEYETISLDRLADIISNESDAYTVINVHIPYAGEIDGTDANVPYNDVEALKAAIPDKNAPVVLYCRSGNMSEQASRALLAEGYTNILDVPGGMAAWQSSGRTLIDR